MNTPKAFKPYQDVTYTINPEGCGLFLVAAKDGNNCGFTAARIFYFPNNAWFLTGYFLQHCLHYYLKS
jgi:hypothetical protein